MLMESKGNLPLQLLPCCHLAQHPPTSPSACRYHATSVVGRPAVDFVGSATAFSWTLLIAPQCRFNLGLSKLRRFWSKGGPFDPSDILLGLLDETDLNPLARMSWKCVSWSRISDMVTDEVVGQPAKFGPAGHPSGPHLHFGPLLA